MNPLNSLVPRRILPGELTIARFTQREKSVDIVLVYEVRASGPTAKNNLREYVSQSFNGDIPFAQSVAGGKIARTSFHYILIMGLIMG
jgi:hypothetical protein